jgi:hypothetical protein
MGLRERLDGDSWGMLNFAIHGVGGVQMSLLGHLGRVMEEY